MVVESLLGDYINFEGDFRFSLDLIAKPQVRAIGADCLTGWILARQLQRALELRTQRAICTQQTPGTCQFGSPVTQRWRSQRDLLAPNETGI
jgi:hypothetical protein